MNTRPRRWEAIVRRLPADRAITGAEIGVYRGDTAHAIMHDLPLCTHIMVDPWLRYDEVDVFGKPTLLSKSMATQKGGDDIYNFVVDRMREFGDRAVIMRKTGDAAAEGVSAQSLDYVFIDAMHTYEACLNDIWAWLPKVRPGGWIGGHDFDNLPRFPGIRQAVVEMFGDDIEIDVDCTWFHRIDE